MKNKIYIPHFFLSLITFCFFSLSQSKIVNAQGEVIDTTKMVFASDEVVLFYTDPVSINSNNSPVHKAKYIDFDSSTSMQFLDSVVIDTGFRYSAWNNYGQTAAVGNFYGNNEDEVKYAYVNAQGQYKICDIKVDADSDTFMNQTNCANLNGVIQYNNISAVGANLRGDYHDEFVLGYATWNNEYKVLSDTFTYTEAAINGYVKLSKGDFDGDGIDEIVYMGMKYQGSNRVPYIRVIRNNLSLASAPLYLDTIDASIQIAVRCADVTGDGKDDIVFAYARTSPQYNSDDTWMGYVEVNTNLTSFVYNQNNNLAERRSPQNGSDPISLAIDVADLNFNGSNEIVLGAGSSNQANVGIYQISSGAPTLVSNQISYTMDQPIESNNWIVAGDFNPQTNGVSLMVLESTESYNANSGYTHTFETKVYDVEPGTFNISLDNSNISSFQSNYSTRYFDLLKLDADNDKIKLGKGTYYSVTQYGQPVAVLNVPPIHFDVIDGDTIDLNDCHNNASCGSSVNYTTTTSSGTVFTTEVAGSYGFSNSVTASAKFGPLKVESKVEQAGGTSLSNLKSNGKSFTSSVSVDLTREGDHVYSLVSDYHIWEYPVYIDDEYQGTFITVQPDSNTANMVYTEGKVLNNYHFDHEPSNILSYKNYTLPMSQNANANDSFYVAAPVTINGSSSITNTWEFGQELNTAVSTTKEKSLSVSGSLSLEPEFDFFGVEVGVGMSTEIGRSFSNSQMSTVESTLSNSFSVSVNPGGIAQNLVSTRSYKVQPYLYYDTKGILYVDYAVTFHPEAQTGTTTSSWFYDKYGSTTNPKQDPAFIMPFKLNDAKGYGAIHEIDKDRSSSIQMWPRNPNPGDTVLIGANVHNFSLGPNPSDNVEILFYAESGQAIANHCKVDLISIDSTTAGKTLFNLGPINPRESKQVQFKCVFPGGLGPNPRIYGVIDPYNKITDEIHERNNKAFYTNGGFLPLSAPPKDSVKYYTGTVYVDANVNGSNQKGDSWANALTELSDVLNPFNTAFPDTVKVAQGTYMPLTTGFCNGRKNHFFIPDSVVVLGGYPTAGGLRDWKNNVTILSGDLSSPSDTDNCFTVVYTNGTAVTIDGFIIEKGNANQDYQSTEIQWWSKESAGGALYIDGEDGWGQANPQVSNCIFRDNYATRGGAIFVNGRDTGQANPNFLNCTFHDNTGYDGGAMMTTAQYQGQANPKVYQCLFHDNEASNEGGAIFTYARYSGVSEPDVRQSTFAQNDGNSNTLYQRYAGAVLHLKNCIVWGEIASSQSAAMTDSTNFLKSTSTTYPDFVDSTNNNFRLTLCSPAVNAASASYIPIGVLQDLDGENRVQNANPDLGAYEGIEVPKLIQTQANTTVTATEEYTDNQGWTHYCACDSSANNNDAWMLSVKKNGNSIGQVGDVGFNVSTTTTSLYGTNAATDLSSASYVTADTFYAFNRYWELSPIQQPTSVVEVRFPYSNTDFADLQGSQGGVTNHEDMAFFKIDSGYNPHSLVVPSSAYHHYANGSNAGTSTWKYINYTAEIPNTHLAEYAVNSFSGGGGGFGNGLNNGPLPVTYTNFHVEKLSNSNLLKWITISEINNSHFNIQRSADAINFIRLSRINSKRINSSTNKQIDYSYMDSEPQIGHNYYRLEQVDIDGKKSYSKIIDIVWTKDRKAIALYPNPTSGTVYLKFDTDVDNELDLRVIDLRGQVLKSVMAISKDGTNQLEISLEDLSNGIYTIQLFENGQQRYIGKVSKQ